MRSSLHSVDAERSLVGAAMIDNSVMSSVGAMVKPEDFTVMELRATWGAMINLAAKGQPCDIVTVSERLEANRQLETNGLSLLAEIARNTPSASNAKAYADVVADLSQRRALLEKISALGESLHDRGQDIDDIIGQAKGHIETVSRATKGDVLAPVSGSLSGILDTIDKRFNGEEEPMGRTTGLKDLDNRLMGLCPGLHILGARPSMGKTAAMLFMASADMAAPSYIASLEMPEDRLIQRMMACLGNMPLAALKDPAKHMNNYWHSLTVAMTMLKDAPFYIRARGGLSVEEMRRDVLEIADRHGKVGFIGVDYLQKVPSRKDYGSRHDMAVGEVAQDLKKLGDEVGAPVLALSQLNRALEQRPNKRPIMSDLKESSVIEQEAETITFLYRDEVYNPDNPDVRGLAEFINAKNRDGETGVTHTVSRLDRGRFEDLAPTSMMASSFPE